MDRTPFVSLFIPTYNDAEALSACLDSIMKLDYPRSRMELFIWDNASKDDTIRMVEERFNELKKSEWRNLTIFRSPKNEGCYIPYNLAVSRFSKKSEYLLGLDADVELAPNTLRCLIEAAVEDHAAIVGARSVYFDAPNKTSHGAGFINHITGWYSVRDLRHRSRCDYVIGCCWLLDKAIFNALGHFDPDYYINHWEVDYCTSAGKRGFTIIYEPGAVVKHRIPENAYVTPERLYYLVRNKMLLINKHLPLPWRPLSKVLHVLTWFCKGMVVLIINEKGLGPKKMKILLMALWDGIIGRWGKLRKPLE